MSWLATVLLFSALAAAVSCQCTHGEVRAHVGSYGRVEVCVNETWGTVCDEFWDNQDASVVCRQLGFSPHGAIAGSGSYTEGSLLMHIIDVNCTGSELTLLDCPYNSLTSVSGICGQYKDASIICQDHTATDDMSSCSLNEYLLLHEIEEEKERVVETIRNLMPFDLPASNSSNPEAIATEVYEQLAVLFDEVPSTASHNQFTTAVDDIHSAYAAECDGASSGILAFDVISSLAAKFRELTRGPNGIHAHKEALDEARDIYGKFLCYHEKAAGGRRKRQAPVAVPSHAVTRCNCPAVVSKPCHFFACLEVTETKFIMGFGNSLYTLGCIGFIVDTSGSMTDEIAATRRIILQFIKSQADSTTCYLLVPFNDNLGDIPDVGPISYAFTFGTAAHLELQAFEGAVTSLYAHEGGDVPEYAFSAIEAALDYSFYDTKLNLTIPLMGNGADMIVITDAPSKLPELRMTVIKRAKLQGVTINFILGGFHSFYEDIADATGGVVYDDHHTTWSILQFYDLVTGSGRKKRSATLSGSTTVGVSRFVYAFRVSILTTGIFSGHVISITLPDGSTENTTVEDSVMIYLKSNPIPGQYSFGIAGSSVVDGLIHHDVSLDVSLFYFDRNFTVSSPNPLAACTSGKLALTTSRISEISSLSLIVSSSGSSKIIPLTKCSNAFTTDYNFTAGNYSYAIEGVDSVGVDFTYDLDKTAIVGHHPSGTYSLTSTNTSSLEINFSDHFNMEFELRSSDHIGTTNFTLSASGAGFVLSLDSTVVELKPMQARNITVTGSVGSSTVSASSNITITASNGCVSLTAKRLIAIQSVATMAPSVIPWPTDSCGCLNGGTCIENSFRGRIFRRCQCPPSHGGPTCAITL